MKKRTGSEKKKYSYIKKKFAVNGFYAFAVMLVALSLVATALYLGVSSAGNGGLNLGALGVSGLLMAFMSLRFAFISRREEGRDYVFSLISAAADILIIIALAAVLYIGLRA